MRGFFVVVTALACAHTAVAVEGAAEPLGEPLAPEAPAVPTPREHPGSPDKAPDKTPGKLPPKAVPAPDAPTSEGGFGAGPCIGAGSGCVALGCIPGVGTGVGATILIGLLSAAVAQGGVAGTCLAVFGIGGGVVVGAPSAVLLGPCGSVGALGGGIVGAIVDERPLAPVFLGAAPGLLAGALSTAGAVWGLVVLSNNSADSTTPAVILGTSAAVAVIAGPLTIIGIGLADGAAGPSTPGPPSTPPLKPADSPTAQQATMRF